MKLLIQDQIEENRIGLMNFKDPSRHQSTHLDQPLTKLPQILLDRTGYMRQLEMQQSRKVKRELNQQIVRDKLDESYNQFAHKQREYYNVQVRRVDDRLIKNKKQKSKNNQKLIKMHSDIMKKAHENKQNAMRKEERARKQMYAVETSKLEKSILLRSTFLSKRSIQSKTSASARSLDISGVQSDIDKSLSQINSKLERAKQNRQSKINSFKRAMTKVKDHREQALIRSVEDEEKFKNQTLRSYMKTFNDFKLRMSEIDHNNQLKIQARIKRQNERKELANHKSTKLKQQSIHKMRMQHQSLERKMDGALKSRLVNFEQKTQHLADRTKEKLSHAKKQYEASQSTQFTEGWAILRKFNQDHQVFKLFKSELQKSTLSKHSSIQ